VAGDKFYLSVRVHGLPRGRKLHRKTSMIQREKLLLLVLVYASICSRPNWVCAQSGNANLPDDPSHVSRYSDRSDSPSEREVTWRSLPKDFLHDQKDIWLFPGQLAKGRHWLPTLAIIGGTAGLIVADSHAMPYFRSHERNLDDVNDVFDAPITSAEVIVLPVSLLVAGYVRHDSYQTGTALLAGEAYADSAIVDLAIKATTRRERPSDVPPGRSFDNTFFNGGKSPFKGSLSIRPRRRCIFGGHGRCQPVPPPPLGALGIVWIRNGYQLFSSNHERSFSVRRISWSSSRLHDHALRSATTALMALLT
jgi:hypothetical protein